MEKKESSDSRHLISLRNPHRCMRAATTNNNTQIIRVVFLLFPVTGFTWRSSAEKVFGDPG